jgi:hypothetical protein
LGKEWEVFRYEDRNVEVGYQNGEDFKQSNDKINALLTKDDRVHNSIFNSKQYVRWLRTVNRGMNFWVYQVPNACFSKRSFSAGGGFGGVRLTLRAPENAMITGIFARDIVGRM